MNKKFLFSFVISALALICLIWFVFAAAPDSPSLPNSPSEGHVFYGNTTSIVLNVTVTDADGDDMNVSFYKSIISNWWNSSWGEKKEIEVSVISNSTHKNYQVNLNITYDSDMNSGFDDLRFINGSENSELDYWIEEKVNSSWASVWVKVDQNITTSNYIFYMYYGNPNATSKSNGLKTFEAWDDFEDGSISSNWTQSTGTFSESEGQLNVKTTSSQNGRIYWNYKKFDPELGYRFYSKYRSESGSGNAGNTLSETVGSTNVQRAYLFPSFTDYFIDDDGDGGYEENGAMGTQQDVWYNLELKTLFNRTEYFAQNNLNIYTHNSSYYLTNPVYFSFGYFAGNKAIAYNVSLFYVTKYHYSSLSYGFGSEEKYLLVETLLNTSTDVANGSVITCNWTNLSSGNTYSWYVNVTDGTDTTQSSIWSFSINYPPTDPTSLELNDVNVLDILTAVCSGSTDADNNSITYYYEFYNVNDSVILQSWDTDNTYIIQSSDSHDMINVTCKAYDSINYSTHTMSNSTTVENSLPSSTLNSPSNKEVFSVNTTSVILNITITDVDGDTMNATFYNLSDDSPICANTSIANGSDVICNWTGLSEGIYGWYVNVTDGTDTNTSSTSNFSILSSFCSSSISLDYTMSSSIYCNDTAVSFANDNITFDCDDNSVVFVGSDNYGKHAFSVSFVDNITIQNCNMKGLGIYAENATNLDILDNEIYNLSAFFSNAIHIENGENITIKNNLFNATDVVMDEHDHTGGRHWKAIMVNYYYLTEINSTRNLVIYNNTMFDHEWSMDIKGVTGLNVSRNKINITKLYRAPAITLRRVIDGVLDRNVQYSTINDSWQIDSDGYVVDSGSRNITISNGRITNPNVHGIIMLDILGTDEYPQNVTIKNMTIINPVYSSARGIYFYGGSASIGVYTENSSVIGNNISLCLYGIEVGSSHGGASNSRFINNTIYDVSSDGINDYDYYHERANNLFENNTIYNTGRYPVGIRGAINYSFINNTIHDSTDQGMRIYGVLNNNTFIDNIIYNVSTAIEYSGDNATFTGNLVYDLDGYGIKVYSNCNLTGNTIRNATRGIDINGDNNNISSNVLEDNDYGIYLSNSDNNSFYDMDASDSVLMDIYSSSSSSTNNYFTNVSHDKLDVSVLNSANISFKWYLDAHATNTNGEDLSNVTIIGLDKNNNQQFSNTTNENGSIQRQTVDEYYQTSLGRTYFTSYEISASKSGYVTEDTTQNITDNVLLDFSLSWNSSTSGNRGGSGACTTQWNCSEWGECVDNIQTRICSYSENWCEPREDKPVEFQMCVVDIDKKEENNIIEEIIKEWNFMWLIVLLILVIAIMITKKIKEKRNLRKSSQLKRESSLVGWKM